MSGPANIVFSTEAHTAGAHTKGVFGGTIEMTTTAFDALEMYAVRPNGERKGEGKGERRGHKARGGKWEQEEEKEEEGDEPNHPNGGSTISSYTSHEFTTNIAGMHEGVVSPLPSPIHHTQTVEDKKGAQTVDAINKPNLQVPIITPSLHPITHPITLPSYRPLTL